MKKYAKSLPKVYLDPGVVVDMIEGEPVPAALLAKYENKLLAIGAIEAEAAAQNAPSKPKKREK